MFRTGPDTGRIGWGRLLDGRGVRGRRPAQLESRKMSDSTSSALVSPAIPVRNGSRRVKDECAEKITTALTTMTTSTTSTTSKTFVGAGSMRASGDRPMAVVLGARVIEVVRSL